MDTMQQSWLMGQLVVERLLRNKILDTNSMIGTAEDPGIMPLSMLDLLSRTK